jgi:glutathione peroxidase
MAMHRATRAFPALLCAALSLAGAACADKAPGPDANPAPLPQPSQAANMTLYDFTMSAIDGQPAKLSEYKGKVVLVVNTASECGYTPQYAGLVRLHEKLAARGFSVIGFPSNDFGAQEPGSDQEIKTFCDTKFKVSFPLFSKSVVKGKNKSPLYAFLTSAPPGGEVKWNFEKFLIGKDGKVAGRYPSSVEPEDQKLVADIETALAR